jgi:hypothetical protein
MLAIQRDAKAELNRRSQVCAVLAGTGVRVAENRWSGCGRRPSRSALGMNGVLRLMLRTQPRSENWPGGSCTRVDACFPPPPLTSCSRSRLTRPLSRPPRHQSIFGGSVKLDRIPFFANLVLAFLHVLRRNRTGEAKSTGPNSGFEIFVRGVRTDSLDES